MFPVNKSTNFYLSTISILGILTFLMNLDIAQIQLSEWLTVIALAGAVALLNYHIIYIPPNDNTISMDSAILLASLFLYGLDLTLCVLGIVCLVYGIHQRRISWWKHLFNFAIYVLMISAAYYILISIGGTVGQIDTGNVIPYILSLTTYFFVNTILVIFYFKFSGPSTFKDELKRISTDKTFLSSYFAIMILSLILGILLYSEHYVGLFLFTFIALLLSIAFDQHFKLYQTISEKANKDYLTGLNNHGYFKELLETEILITKESTKPMSVALLDIDDFKKYNDLYGHIKGDQLLTFFGSILENEASKKQYIVGRYGGEEFAILMPNTTERSAYIFVDQLRKKVNDSYFDGVEALPYGCLSFSSGICECEQGIYDSSELLNKADQAMYYGKSQGKNNVQLFSIESENMAQSNIFDREIEDAEQQLKIFMSKDVYTYRHSKRVFQYAAHFSSKLNLSETEKKILIHGALLHDIGKLEIPRDILNKKGKLSQNEWEMIKKHVTWGKEIISSNKKLEPLIPVVELHHERYDGKGYPYGLKGENIPKLARILCIVDSFDAMTTERPYQKTKTFSEAISELRRCSGDQFDPQFVEPFIEMIKINYAEMLEKETVSTM